MEELYTVNGIVVRGEARGKDLGFPTANIALTTEIPEGIYASDVTVDGKMYHAASFVGSAKTFESVDVKLESYILDFHQDLYGKKITVKLYHKIRENVKFNSVEELVEQMHKDVEEINETLVRYKIFLFSIHTILFKK